MPVHVAVRTGRRWLARGGGALLAACPFLEAPFIAVGRATRHSRVIGSLYWHTQSDLIPRMRRSGDRFRRLPVAGIDVFVDVTDGTGRLHYFYDEPYEPELVAALPRLLKPGDVFIDVGANIGFLSTVAARLVGPTGHVVAFEPHPDALSVFRAAAGINGVSGDVEIVEAAVGSKEGTTKLFLTIDSVLSTTDPSRAPLRDEYPFDRAIDVQSVTLDSWLLARPDLLPKLAAIKIDVEGTEDEVFAGMRETLAACPKAAVICETDHGSLADASLRGMGYTAETLDVRSGTFGNYLYTRGA